MSTTPDHKSVQNVTPSSRRIFAAHFILGGGVKWEDTSGMAGSELPENSLTLYMSLTRGEKREVLRFIAKALVGNQTEWFSLDGNRWRVDYDKLRAFFKLRDCFDWLTGSAFVEPDYDTTEHKWMRGTETRSLVTLAFERDTLQQTLETDEERRTRIFDAMRFHQEVVATCRSRFIVGQTNDAIFQGCLRLNAVVQARSGVSGMDGDPLFGHVFKSDAPKLSFTPCSNGDERNEQEGFRFLFQGMAKAIRNPRGHRPVGNDEVSTIEHLAFLSMLLRYLDEAK
jgi:uncharacterized protein (TIGR02391 family)